MFSGSGVIFEAIINPSFNNLSLIFLGVMAVSCTSYYAAAAAAATAAASVVAAPRYIEENFKTNV